MDMYTEGSDKSKTIDYDNGMKLIVNYGTRNDDGVCDWNQQRIEGDFRKSILYDKNGEVIEKLIEPNPFVDRSYENNRYQNQGNNRQNEKIYFNNGMRITFDFGSKLRDGTYNGWGMDNNHGSGMRVIIYDEHINTITEKHMENNVSKSIPDDYDEGEDFSYLRRIF